MNYRSVGASALLVCGVLALCAPALAQKYPNQPIHMVVPVPAGGGVDIISRAVGQKIGESFGVAVVIENKPGASAAIGSEFVAKSPADGYTLLMGYSALTTNPFLIAKLPYDLEKDLVPVVYVGYIPLILVTQPDFPANSVSDLIAMAKAKPGQLTFASGGAGAGAHLSGELFNSLANVKLVHVPYKGNAPALNDLLGGHVNIMFDTITTSLPQVKAGKLKALAVTSVKRSPLAPEYPTMIEAGLPNFEVTAWYAIFAPKKTPADIVLRINQEVNKALSDPDFAAKMASQGITVTGGTPQDVENFVQSESKKWGAIIKATGMKAE